MEDFIIPKKKLNEALKRLEELQDYTDFETGHGEADDIIISLLPDEIKKVYSKIGKWYA